MFKFIRDVIFGEPIVSITILSLVLTAWLAALTQLGDPVPLWLAIAAPSTIAIGGFYGRAVTEPTRPDIKDEPEPGRHEAEDAEPDPEPDDDDI